MQFRTHTAIIVSIMLCSICGVLNAQDLTLIPALKDSLRKVGSDSLRVELLWQVGYNYSQSNPDSGVHYAKKSYDISKRIHFIKGLGDSENIWGFSLTSAGKFDSAHVHYENSMKYFKQINDPCNTTVVMGNWGWNYLNHHEDVKGLECFLEAEKLDRMCDSRGWKSTTYYNIGAAYNRMNEYDKAILYFDQAIGMDIEKGDSAKLAISTLGKANAFRGMNNLDEAEVYYKKAMRLNEVMGNEYTLGFVYENLSQLLFDKGKQEEAIMYCRKALDIFKRLDRPGDVIYESLLLGTMLNETNRTEEAETILLGLLPLTFIHETPYERKETYERLSHVYNKQGKPALAYQYLSKFVALKDSLNEEDQKATLAELTTRFETEKKDQQLEVERANRDRETERAEKQTFQKYVFLTGAIVFALIALVLINRFQIKKRTAQALEEKNRIIERERDRAERSEKLKQQFLANMSHEIRTPMNAINGLSRILLDKDHDPQTREYLQAISHSGENMQVILNDILDLSKLESGQFLIHPVAFDLRREAENVMRIFNERASEKGLTLKLTIDPDLPAFIKADAARLSQIWSNLISNAIKFTSKGGVQLNLKRGDSEDSLSVEVIDSGIGMSADELPHIFESFVQITSQNAGRTDGTGLGLTIARNLVERMGGKLDVKSEVGVGTEFHFVISFRNAVKEEVVQLALKADNRFADKHVIVAEDNEYNFMVVRDVLMKYYPGMGIHRAHNGLEVIEMLNEDDYDLILMDVQMPEMNGYEATKVIRGERNYIPIIALTASVTQHELDMCYEAGMNEVVLKPFRDEDLISVFNKSFKLEVKVEIDDNTADTKKIFAEFAPALLDDFKQARINLDEAKMRSTAHTARPLLIKCGYHDLVDQCILLENAQVADSDLWQLADRIIETFQSELNQITKR
jgi:signal transduction histidine kinase/CheY-like chemotaxis protein/Tfp pilus assembly protein PilF